MYWCSQSFMFLLAAFTYQRAVWRTPTLWFPGHPDQVPPESTVSSVILHVWRVVWLFVLHGGHTQSA